MNKLIVSIFLNCHSSSMLQHVAISKTSYVFKCLIITLRVISYVLCSLIFYNDYNDEIAWYVLLSYDHSVYVFKFPVYISTKRF